MKPSFVTLGVYTIAVSALGFVACGPDRDLTPTTSSGTGGAGATGGTGATTSSATQGGSDTTSTPTTPEPSGPTKLTVVNGIADYKAIRVCFMPYPETADDVDLWPASAAGLAFPKAQQIDPPKSISVGGADVQPHVIGGDLSAIEGLSCKEAMALAKPVNPGSGGAGGTTTTGGGGLGGTGTGGNGTGGNAGAGGAAPNVPPIVVSAMPVIPASVLETEKSLLLVFFGCMGGPGHADGTEGLGCGFAYTPSAPNANLTLVAMSRVTDPSRIGIQFVHASVAMQPSDMRILPGFENATDVQVAAALALGGLAPKPAFLAMSRNDFGLLSKAALRTYAPNSTSLTSAAFIQDAFVNGEITDTEFVNGKNFTFVAVGGYPGVAIPSFWNTFTYAMVPSDPE
ncbi:MAG: hypothetical protein IPK82_19485 [Polyangiaceae bacterium]|nr:hypothetical protein [Polyangiaceae bacterium]